MKLNLALLACVFALSSVAQQSSITEADGYSCMGVDYSKKETEQLALQDAKRQAVEFSKSYIEIFVIMLEIKCSHFYRLVN